MRRPYVVGEALIPERQTGLQVYGSQLVGSTELGYSLSLSNGRGPIDSHQDLDANKAVTGRVWLNSELPIGTINLGYTLFRGRYTDRVTRFTVIATGEFGTEYISVNRYDELAMAADLRWVWEDLTLQSELILREVALDDRFRAAAFPGPGEPQGFAPDFRSTGFYAMAAYRLPWFNLMPTPRVVLKAQFTKSWFMDDTAVVGDDGVEAIDLQAAWSF